ncbi:uncharacterized protein LOC113509510 [Galleria mellonella]|uniref:Uncharacterized protein LOC113509510 n=1 Tax=Galleria mellonella TaxID=7137 RepID=A0A6J1W804_GALME|nr:uncharacterized protein LOC113509510 [Galleria mellonella]
MADDNTIIEGTVKFRDGKKWKSRWCVMRKLSPVADCVHLQLYRDSKARWGGATTKASLSLQQYLGCESGFTLDKHSNTLALVCRDLVAILAFETRERLIQWQVKVSGHLGEPRHYLVLVGGGGSGGGKRLPPGPARLHLHERRFALTAGVPPRLLGIWELAHLRRFGVVEGRFCFEGGSHCGKGEGLHVLISDQAREIAHDFNLASQGRLSPKRRPLVAKKSEGAESPKSHKTYRPDTRLSELQTVDHSVQSMDRLYEDPCIGEEAGAISPYWPSTERTHFQDMGLGDTASVNEAVEGTDTTPWNMTGNVTLERCMSCISKLGALSRSSTAALTPGAKHFNPAWTMEAVNETPHVETVAVEIPQSCDEYSNIINKTEELCHCDVPPHRPPKPTRLDLNLNKKPPMPLPLQTCSCSHVVCIEESKSSKIGPYENYDVPKVPSAEVEGEYYDTPKRLKECLNSDLFKITKNSTTNTLILKKPCGCLLKFGKRPKEPTIIDADETLQPTSNCACQRVTDWANNWIKIPYCRKNTTSTDNLTPNKENLRPPPSDRSALYATIDLSRKTKRKLRPSISHDEITSEYYFKSTDTRKIEIDEGPLANYENLSFALSLEHYENAKDLLRKAGITQSELNAITTNLKPIAYKVVNGKNVCTKCGHPQMKCDNNDNREANIANVGDDYLMMEPNTRESNKIEQNKHLPAGYTPMSPIGGFAFHTMKHSSKSPINRLLEEKSASNPTLCGSEEDRPTITDDPNKSTARTSVERVDKIEYRKRSSSADSSRFLEDVKEFEGSVGSHGSTSSIETLRNIALETDRVSTSCECAAENKHSDADSSEASKGTRGRGVVLSKRSSSVPGKAGGNRDSSSSNDSGVSSCSLRPGGELAEFELPLTTAATRRHYRSARRAAGALHISLPRRSKSTDPLQAGGTQSLRIPAKSSSAEAEVPVLSIKPLRGVVDTHSTSSGTSDMSDYIETLSICSSHSSTDTPITMRVVRQTTSTLRPRSGKEYHNLDPRLTSVYRAPLSHPAQSTPSTRHYSTQQ